jgi:hypothetical protein
MTTFTEKTTIRRYVLDYEENRFFYLSDLAFNKYKELTSKNVYNNGYDIYHDDPILIKIVEELGSEKASGQNSNLKIFDVKEGTIGVVYNPMRPKLSLSSDGKKLFKSLSGYDYSDNVLRHDKHLVEVYEKLGDYACCYPFDFIDIEYIDEDKIDNYKIANENDSEKIIFTNSDEKIKSNKIYGLFYQKNMFEKSLKSVSFNNITLQNMISEEKDKYNVEEIELYVLENNINNENDSNDNNYSLFQKSNSNDYSKLNSNNFYCFIKNVEESFPLVIQENNGICNNSSLEIFIEKEILLYIDNIDNFKLLKSIPKYSNSLSDNNILFDKYYSDGIVNNK